MKNLFKTLLCLSALALFSCRANVDLANIDDPTIKLGFGAALPVGEMSARLGDFLQGDISDMLLVGEDGVLSIYDSVQMEVTLDNVDMAEYFEPASARLVVGDLLPDWLPVGYGPLIGNGEPIIMTCPIGLSLGGINQSGSSERIDSAVINVALFNAMISIENMDGMTFDKIESVELILPDEFERAEGNTISIDLDGKGYGQQIPVVMDNFTLNLVKDPNQPLSTENAIDSVTLMLRFTLSLENGETIMIQTSSAFDFSFAVSTFDYAAVFGNFDTSDLETSETMDIDFSEMLPIWDRIGSFKMPFADPRIDLSVTTNIGAPMAIHIDKISTTDRNTGEKKYADFSGSRSTEMIFTNLVMPNDPYDTEKTNDFHLSKDPAEGHIDNLFTVEPQKLEFAYNAYIRNTPDYPQLRLTKGAHVGVTAEMTMPFEFNKGLNLAYSDTLKDVSISSMSIDSLLSGAEMVDSLNVRVLKLVIVATNSMPFNVELELKPLDEGGNKVMDMQPLLIAAPSEWDAAKNCLVPGRNELVINVTEDKLADLSKVKNMVYTATLCDTNLKEGMQNVPQEAYPIAISTEGQLSFNIAITADVEAYLKLQFNGKE